MFKTDYTPLFQTIHDLKAKIKQAGGQHQLASREDIEKIAAEIWDVNLKADEYFNKETPLPLEKVTELQLELASLFDLYSVLLDAAWHVDPALFEPYDQLVKARNDLEHLKRRGYYSNKEVSLIQDRINRVENQNVKDQKFLTAKGEVGLGQAVMFTLLYHTHRAARLLLLANEPINQFLAPLKKRLEDVIKELDALAADREKTGQPVHLGKLQLIQETLRSIDASKKDGKFVPADWNPSSDPNAVPEGQAFIQSLLEEAYDKVHELLSGPTNDVVEGTPVFAKLKQVLDSLDKGAIEEKQAHTLQKSIWDAVDHLKKGTIKASSNVGALITSGYSSLNSFFARNLNVGESVDPKLSNFHQELISIRDGLKKVRSERAFAHYATQHGSTEVAKKLETELDAKFESLRQRLSQMDGRRVNGRFVGDDGSFAPKGQALLSSLLEEDYALVYEIQNQ